MKTNDIKTNVIIRSPGKRFLAVFFALTTLGLVLVSLIVIIIDPFFRYHDPLKGFPYVIDNQLSQNIGLAEHFACDAVITGSSMTMNFDTDEFTGSMGLHPLKLTMNGALPHDIARILRASYAGKNGGGLRAVFIAIDPETWTAERGAVKYPYPEYLYDRNPVNDVKYLWNLEVLLDYCLRPIAEREPTDLSMIYATTWEDELYYTLEWILEHYTEPAPAETRTPADAYLADTQRNLDEELLPFIDAHPETTFYFFYPPYSLLFWHDVVRQDHLDATIAQSLLIGEALLGRENVRVFQFQDVEEIVSDIDGGYMDEIHFRPSVNSYMVNCFASGEREISDSDAMRDVFRHLRGLITDFEAEEVPKLW